MLTYPDIDPVAISAGPFEVHWYGLMYLIAFIAGWWLGRLRTRRPGTTWKAEEIGDLVFYFALGAILGGRIGYTLMYNLPGFIEDPLVIVRIWQGGMSYHGGMVGVLVAMWLYGRHTNRTFFFVTDYLAPLVPIGLGAGRIGNFINGELWGRPTDLPWGMVFPFVDALPRHPSMLYEALLEGLVFFIILWVYSRRPRPTMAVSGLYLLTYGVFRFLVEFVRLPDAHIGYLAFDWLTMGHVLTLPMVVLGGAFMVYAYRRKDGAVSW
ncbi:MAG: prolipoprotein diacylglyceryl transferase [Gammaproteobacteria bacterium]|jgi:phosphatidylglycerol:prolipoprotein diacylglycerol transferase|nr:prolipoprotein diacylglyceryl transferase [Gammaproteobacteria bacterium]